jgi:hypothetical protein
LISANAGKKHANQYYDSYYADLTANLKKDTLAAKKGSESRSTSSIRSQIQFLKTKTPQALFDYYG